MAVMNFDVKIIGGNARDSIANVLAARGLDDHNHVLVCPMANNAKETRELCLDKAPVERELATSEGLCRGKRGLGFTGRSGLRGGCGWGVIRKPKTCSMGRRSHALHWIDRVRTFGTSSRLGFPGLLDWLSFRRHCEKNNRGEDSEQRNGRKAGNERNGLRPKDCDLIACINRSAINHQQQEQAETRGEKRAEQRLRWRTRQSRRLLEVGDLGFFCALFGCNNYEWFNQRAEFGAQLRIVPEFSEVFLRKTVPGNFFVVAFAHFHGNAGIIGRS